MTGTATTFRRVNFLLAIALLLIAAPCRALASEQDISKMSLVGILYTNSSDSVAYIVLKNHKQHSFHENDFISGKLKVIKINPKFIMVMDGKYPRKIRINGYKGPGGHISRSVETKISARKNGHYDYPGDRHEVVIRKPGRDADYIQQKEDGVYTINKSYLLRMVDSGRILPYVSLEKTSNEKVMVSRIMPGSFFARAGLKKSDIINKINGVEVHKVGDLIDSTKSLSDQDMLELSITRNNKQTYLYYFIGEQY